MANRVRSSRWLVSGINSYPAMLRWKWDLFMGYCLENNAFLLLGKFFLPILHEVIPMLWGRKWRNWTQKSWIWPHFSPEFNTSSSVMPDFSNEQNSGSNDCSLKIHLYAFSCTRLLIDALSHNKDCGCLTYTRLLRSVPPFTFTDKYIPQYGAVLYVTFMDMHIFIHLFQMKICNLKF